MSRSNPMHHAPASPRPRAKAGLAPWPFPPRLLDYPSAPPLARPVPAPIAPPPNAPEAPF